MTVKQYLFQVQEAKKKLLETQNLINDKRSLLTSISASTEGERVQSSASKDKIASILADILDREKELELDVQGDLNLERKITNEINEIDIPKYREVLFWRYIGGKKFDDIERIIGKSRRHTNRIHGEALLEFKRKYEEYFKNT